MDSSAYLLSCCLIVKNEAENLARCLESIQAIADELIVVDTGSEDETIEIAQQYNAQIYHFDWCNDFAAARNFAISKAQGAWIFMPDADEALQCERLDLKATLIDATSEVFAFQIPIVSTDADFTEMLAPRLFRNHPALYYEGRYHEILVLNRDDVPNASFIGISGISILHYGYSEDLQLPKSQRRIPMLEAMRQTQDLDWRSLLTLASMYRCTQQMEKMQDCYDEALERLTQHLLDGNCPVDQRAVPTWLLELGHAALKNEDLETLRYICWRGLAWFSSYPPLYLLTGLMLKQLGFHRGAIPYFQQCLDFGTQGSYSKAEPFEPSILTLIPACELALAYEALDDPERALEFWNLCLLYDNDFPLAKAKLENAALS